MEEHLEFKIFVKGGCKWNIGTRENINIWDQNWLQDGLSIAAPMQTQLTEDIKTVKDIIMSNSKSWDIDKISTIFDSITARHIINTPLLPLVRTDKLVWKFEHDGAYMVRNAYNYYVNCIGSQNNLGIAGNWHQIWRAKVPPKVKNLLWRIYYNVLPTWQDCIGIQCSELCVVCNDSAEDHVHVLFLCPRSKECWQQIGLWNHVNASLNISNNITHILLSIMQNLNKKQKEIFSVLLWSMWKRRNSKVWDNIHESTTTVCEQARHIITSWQQAQQFRSSSIIPQSVQHNTHWEKPSRERYKCNIDASFPLTHNKVGICISIRDDHRRYMTAKTDWFEPFLDVDVGEAMGLLSTLKWANELQLRDKDFEMDCKRVVDCLYSSRTYNSELGEILEIIDTF